MARLRIDYPRRGRSGIRRFIPSFKLVFGTIFLGGAAGAAVLTFLVMTTDIPAPNDVAQANTTIVYYADGRYEIGRIGDFNRVEVELAAIPLDVQRTVLAAEDKTFYEHSGFSLTGIGRAVLNNLGGNAAQGGSTITQQYAKNAYLSSERSITRKVKELVLSIKLETSTSKDEILNNYLNTVYFGRGAYGIQAAAKGYFGKDVSKLKIEQAAMLSALLKSPEGFAPEVDLARLTERWNYVLDQMVDAGWLESSVRAEMVFPEFKERRTGNRLAGPTGYILQEVKNDMADLGYDEAALGVAGFSIITTIDRTAQLAAVKAVKDEGPTTGTEGLRIGLAAVRPGTGEIIAMYGGADYVTEPLNNATQAIAQAGSTFKPFALIAAAEQGLSLDTEYRGKSGIEIDGYKVNNYSNKSFGRVTLLQATELSINTAYVQLASDLGIDTVIDAAQRAGIPSDTPGIERNLTFVLGTSSPHVMEVANSYATFAAQGTYAENYLISKVTGPNEGLIFEATPRTNNVFSADAANTVNFALQKVVTEGTGYAALGVGRPVAGKTGTTDENKSAWFAGYTPDIAAAIMLIKQDENGNPISLSGTGGMNSVAGGSFPARIFTAFMRGAHKNLPVTKFTPPTVMPSVTATASTLPTDTSTPTDSATATPTDSATATVDPTATEPSPTS